MYIVFVLRTPVFKTINHRKMKRRGKAYLRCTQPTFLLINYLLEWSVVYINICYVSNTVHLYIELSYF